MENWPNVLGTLEIVALMILLPKLSVMVALRMETPNSISLMFPMMLPRAFRGPPDQKKRVFKCKYSKWTQKLFLRDTLPGQAWVLHLDSWVESPGHGRPPSLGDGPSQSRTRVLCPPPQEEEHSPHGCHEPQVPSTAKYKQYRSTHQHTNHSNGAVVGVI